MERSTERTLKALLEQAGLEPKEGDLERFERIIDHYIESLEALHSADVGDEEFGPTFHPEWSPKQ